MTAIDTSTPLPDLQSYLHRREWLDSEERITAIEKPGEGNMNVVLRIVTDRRSFVLKQSRPYVGKYPDVEAPVERIVVEKNFYQAVGDIAVNAHIPNILGFDSEENLLLLEDLGHCEDMVSLYQKRRIPAKELDRLVFILGLIHKKDIDDGFPDNLEMRRLNHQHIFVLPFQERNDFNLDDVHPGLQDLSIPFKTDTALKSIVNRIGKKYLSPGKTLLHGDYYPGSWMTEGDNLYIIDPEFAFPGFAEFDLGIMAAHLIMVTGKKEPLNQIHEKYQGDADKKLMDQVAGIEIIRRLIGLAQLPLDRSLEEKRRLLKKARTLILG
ncbi:phosphotransferase [Pricia sp. S334]|uniref:Phosphotransferase n=1 Tax=Pricia mediterranea TaxID=3076079 RepID=A0ABU3L670_9FLAO|nr:phosphotransferase [Pricia sp. S334]MDT7829244.1 phosphotransferase [Pricia sp. S334]